MRLFNRNREQEGKSQGFWIESVRPSEYKGQFLVSVKNKQGKHAEFVSSTGPESSFQPPVQCKEPRDILSLKRKLSDRRGTPIHPLEHSWSYLAKNGTHFLGTPDHHQLYFHLLESGSGDANDVLLNFDSHDDMNQHEYDPNDTSVNFAQYVGNGFSGAIQKTWDHYVLVAPQKAHGSGMQKFLQERSARFGPQHIEAAWEEAFLEAKQRGGKIVVTIDLDFFGSHDTISFDPAAAVEQLLRIFHLIGQYQDVIKLVHFTESLTYTRHGDDQVRELYEVIAELMG